MTDSTIALGMITFNGYPTIKHAFASAMDSVNHTFIVEGAVPAANVKPRAEPWMSPCKDSRAFLERWIGFSDVTVIPAGPMPTKTHMWNVIMSLAAPRFDYLLMLDDDEVIGDWKAIDEAVDYMDANPTIDRLDFPVVNFFGDTKHIATGGMWSQPHRRLWRLRDGYRFTRHRPPCISTEERGEVFDGLTLYHYSWLGRERALEKSKFYEALRPKHLQYGRHLEWYEKVYLPILEGREPDKDAGFGLHVSETKFGASRLEKFAGLHPPTVDMDIKNGRLVFL